MSPAAAGGLLRDGTDGDRMPLKSRPKYRSHRETEKQMAKIKTHKAASKRFTLTKSGKVKLNHTNRRHKLGLKTAKRKRQLRKAGYLSEAMAPNIRTLIG